MSQGKKSLLLGNKLRLKILILRNRNMFLLQEQVEGVAFRVWLSDGVLVVVREAMDRTSIEYQVLLVAFVRKERFLKEKNFLGNVVADV